MTSEELLLMILEAVANDYEELDTITDQIAEWTETPRSELDTERVKATVADAIASGYISAYELSPSKPHAVEVSTAAQDLENYWFLISERGNARRRESSE
jgi:hypothetical protein